MIEFLGHRFQKEAGNFFCAEPHTMRSAFAYLNNSYLLLLFCFLLVSTCTSLAEKEETQAGNMEFRVPNDHSQE